MTMIVSVIRSNHMHYYDSKLLTIHTVYSPEPADTAGECGEFSRCSETSSWTENGLESCVSRNDSLYFR